MKFLIFLLPIFVFGADLQFSFFKKDSNVKENTLLVIGGIHGDEPGGYFAPSVLVKYYEITKGSVWVVPNLNFDSIVENKRGIYGDMNRKFSFIKKTDEDYESVNKIKELILDKNVDLVLNLHDGYGFYRHQYENSIFNPNAWGQTTIIDQEKINGLGKFGNLDEIAKKVNSSLNKDYLFEDHHSFSVKNTKTKFKDEQQQLSLTYFAVTNNKPAFAIETSKNITDLTQKVIYQLKSIEEFMNIMGIEFKRDFDLNNYEQMKEIVYSFGKINLNNNFIVDLTDVNRTLRYVPMSENENSFEFEHILGTTKKVGDRYEVFIGNINVCDIYPQYFPLEKYENDLEFLVDGELKRFKLSQEIKISKDIKILPTDFRVNIIGFSKSGVDSEDNILLSKNDMIDRFSIDKNSRKYRAEFYKDGKFYGMITLNFLK